MNDEALTGVARRKEMHNRMCADLTLHAPRLEGREERVVESITLNGMQCWETIFRHAVMLRTWQVNPETPVIHELVIAGEEIHPRYRWLSMDRAKLEEGGGGLAPDAVKAPPQWRKRITEHLAERPLTDKERWEAEERENDQLPGEDERKHFSTDEAFDPPYVKEAECLPKIPETQWTVDLAQGNFVLIHLTEDEKDDLCIRPEYGETTLEKATKYLGLNKPIMLEDAAGLWELVEALRTCNNVRDKADNDISDLLLAYRHAHKVEDEK